MKQTWRALLFRALLLAALSAGLLIGLVDSRPNWDDTGVTAGAILVVTSLLAAAAPRRPWIWALAVGAWVPLLGIVRQGNFGSVLGLVIAFIGAYVGAWVRRVMSYGGTR